MSWVTVGVAAAGAVKGSMDAKAARKKQAKHDAFRKQAIAYSPWSKMGDPGAGNFGNTDATSGMIGGGMQGAMMGEMIKGGAAGTAKPDAAVPTAPQGGGALGGDAMSAELGQRGQQFQTGMNAQPDNST